MKIATMTDIHLDTNSLLLKRDVFPDLLAALKEIIYDILLITGDLSNSSRTSINIINKIQEETGKKVLFIPGNHDVTKFADTSWDSYNLLKEHESSLIDKPFIIDEDNVIIGDMGWYDYSYALDIVPSSIIKQRKKSLWDDAKYVKWQMDDEQVFEMILNKFKNQLEEHKDKKVIFVNHFIPYKDFVTYSSDGEWNLCNAFMGSDKIGKLLDLHSNINYVLFGHTHRRYGLIEDYRGKNVICNPVGYAYEWETEDAKTEFLKCINFITI
ncbi:metallophosphoesterase [Bacillus thuringiensis]|nr:metallophosphoesterase [Bacillus thuringiensis]